MKIQVRVSVEGQVIGGGWEDDCYSLIVNGVHVIRNGQPNIDLAQIEEQNEDNIVPLELN